ncbi:hypothetical protein CFIMG_001554RA [Ceratocystis fimbriata CBS 114723]|uniref:Histone-fold domain-containing protein new1 n=2 Tax=Ceratocystis TaxID=5157 RepID=A0A0F8BJH2_CERFI|nr:Histone-fold domain-containing protein new1 [Ceratocystis platani]PHH53382.1 hypothetical protein CFIMG_001554RA [Ceratocystis fimbriata CBS 114723]
MAPGQKLYPRGTVKKIVKAHSNCNLTKNADVLIFLDYMMFMEKLVKEASIETRKKGERNLTPASVNKVVADSLLKFKG